jgi:hypothetical protein
MYENEEKLPRRGNLIYLKGRFGGTKRRNRERHDYNRKAKKMGMEKQRKSHKFSAVVETGFEITRPQSVACKSW